MKAWEMLKALEENPELEFEGEYYATKYKYSKETCFFLSEKGYWALCKNFSVLMKIDWQLKLPEIKPCPECGNPRIWQSDGDNFSIVCETMFRDDCALSETAFFGDTKLDAILLANSYSKKGE